jgi:hypothetical protein
MPATWEGSSFIITYPQSDFDLNDYLLHCQAYPNISYILISSEKHQDGSLHRHAVFHFNKRQRLSKSFFDYQERHPNIKCVGKKKSDWSNVTDYVKKDKDYVEWGTPRHSACTWTSIASCSTRKEAQDLLLSEKPRDAILNARNFDYWLDKVFPMQETSSFVRRSIDQFILPESLQEWILMSYMYVFL